MPARGDGFALLKWVTSFPRTPSAGLPVVTGALLLSDAGTGELRAIIDCASITSLRTGAAAAVSAQALAADGASSVGLIGCGVTAPGRPAASPPPATAPASARTPAPRPPRRSPPSSAGAGRRAEAAAQDVVVTVTPGVEPVILRVGSAARPAPRRAGRRRDGKAEVEPAAMERCRLFCDEWEQAAAGGELAGAVAAGVVSRKTSPSSGT